MLKARWSKCPAIFLMSCTKNASSLTRNSSSKRPRRQRLNAPSAELSLIWPLSQLSKISTQSKVLISRQFQCQCSRKSRKSLLKWSLSQSIRLKDCPKVHQYQHNQYSQTHRKVNLCPNSSSNPNLKKEQPSLSHNEQVNC